jgi:hypothetical protein
MSNWFLSDSPGELIFEHGEDAKEISVVWSPGGPGPCQNLRGWTLQEKCMAYAVGERMIKDGKGW